MASRRRLDAELVRRGLASTRSQAQRQIADGLVTVDGAPTDKPARLVATSAAIVVGQPATEVYASRGAHKLMVALDRLAVSVVGRHCLDAGASTGGFTDVLLRRGARRVIAVDVGYGQLDWRLRQDPAVVVRDRTNVRHLQPGDLPPPPAQLVVADLSFISLRLVIPALREVADPSADFVLMVKPQFEAGRAAVGKGGVVRDPATWDATVTSVVDAARSVGLGLQAACPSPLLGPAGNAEFFIHLRAGSAAEPAAVVGQAVDEAAARRSGARADT
ncbi:MAG: TlyA family RNA methyltransferase [Actinomycetota bacterium]|nr:TlyA family RNA methyltransferase [Actinomycetota bacterium]